MPHCSLQTGRSLLSPWYRWFLVVEVGANKKPTGQLLLAVGLL
jgi:hypothetical protein